MSGQKVAIFKAGSSECPSRPLRPELTFWSGGWGPGSESFLLVLLDEDSGLLSGFVQTGPSGKYFLRSCVSAPWRPIGLLWGWHESMYGKPWERCLGHGELTVSICCCYYHLSCCNFLLAALAHEVGPRACSTHCWTGIARPVGMASAVCESRPLLCF